MEVEVEDEMRCMVEGYRLHSRRGQRNILWSGVELEGGQTAPRDRRDRKGLVLQGAGFGVWQQ